MKKDNAFVSELFTKLLNLPIRDVLLGYGSFITMGFGKNLQTEMMVYNKMEIDIRPEWYLWVYMCFWELENPTDLLATNDDTRETMKEALKHLENKKMVGFEILEGTCDIQLEFEDGILLSLYSNDSEADNTQWMLFTPDQMVLQAGPDQSFSYISESQR